MQDLSRSTEKKGFLCGILAALLYSLMATFIKLSSKGFSVEMMVFFRTLVCCVLILPFFAKSPLSIKTKVFPLHLSRGLIGLAALYAFFFAAKNLFLLDAMTLMNTQPLFIPIITGLWMKEKITKARILSLLLGFLGVVFILKPEFQVYNVFGLVGLLAGFLAALALSTVKKLTHTEPVERILFYFFAISLVVSFFVMLFFWQEVTEKILWVYLVLAGISSFGYQFFITKTYSLLSPSKGCILSYFSVLMAGILGWLIFGQIPDHYSLLGGAIVIIGGVAVMLEKKSADL